MKEKKGHIRYSFKTGKCWREEFEWVSTSKWYNPLSWFSGFWRVTKSEEIEL